GLLLMTAYASSVGGISTPIGTATNVVAMGYLRQPEYLGQKVDFLRWMLVGLPMTLLIFGGLFWWLNRRSPPNNLDMPSLRDYLHREQSSLGPWKRGEINTLIVFLAAIALWVAPGLLALLPDSPRPDTLTTLKHFFANRVPEEIVAVLVPVFLYLLPVD